MTKKLSLLFALMLSTLMVSAQTLIDGIYYNLNASTKEATVTSGRSKYIGSVTIPESFTYNGVTYSVTSIGYYAFLGCSGLTSIEIPNSVTSIGSDAFQDCSGLTSVHITDIAAWCKIRFFNSYSNPLCYAKHLFMDGKEIIDLVIPNSVTSIEDNAFYFCSGLTSVTIPNSVTSIERNAFDGCSGLTSVTIGNSVTSIGNYAFYDCTGLTSVTIGNSVTSIGDGAFAGCSGLTSVTIPNSVTSIGGGAFYGCSSLTSFTIPNSVTSIGDWAFDGVDFPTVISLIENPFAITGKTSDNRTFSQNTFNNATLYVSKGTIEKYKATDGWKDFSNIVELPEVLRGDANGDGEVNMDDATFVTNIILGTEEATEAADVNNDGTVNMPDAMFIVNKILNGKFPDGE